MNPRSGLKSFKLNDGALIMPSGLIPDGIMFSMTDERLSSWIFMSYITTLCPLSERNDDIYSSPRGATGGRISLGLIKSTVFIKRPPSIGNLVPIVVCHSRLSGHLSDSPGRESFFEEGWRES